MSEPIELRSDNSAGVADEIMAAVVAANTGSALAYGGDAWTAQLEATVRERLARLRLQVGRKLMGLGFTPWDAGAFESDEGMFLWLALPTGRRGQPLAADIAFAAETAGLVLAPGNVFSPDGNWPHHLRFNVAQCQDPRVFSILKQLLG